MRQYFDELLQNLNYDIIKMGGMIEDAIEKAIKALKERDVETAKKIIENDREIDDMEREIEKKCLSLLVRQQPMARDLRDISCALKLITDMERIGDHASDIADITIRLAGAEYIKKLVEIPQMAEEAISMTKRAIDAYVKKDIKLAYEVIGYDDVVDDLFDKVKNELVELLVTNHHNVDQALDFLLIAKYLERIADHATNIAEWVIYEVTGVHKG